MTRILTMANGLAYVEVEFDDAGNATAVHVVNGSDKPATGAMNGVPMQVPSGADVTIPIPSPGYPAFTVDTFTASGSWPT